MAICDWMKISHQRFDPILFELVSTDFQLELKSASDGRCVAELLVTRPHLNVARTLHGGLSATLVDSVSTFALLTQRNVRSVSVDLSVR